MKVLLFVFLAVFITGCQTRGYPAGDDSGGYSFVRGEAWRGVSVGGQPPRTASMVCHRSQCYRLLGRWNLPVELLRKYRLTRTDFDALAVAPGVSRQGDTLMLPADLGWQLFYEARRYEHRSNSKGFSSMLLLP